MYLNTTVLINNNENIIICPYNNTYMLFLQDKINN